MSTEVRRPAPDQRRHRVFRRRRVLAVIGVVVVLLAVLAGPSYLTALTRPGTDSFAARTAEWARTHGFSGVINAAERVQYDLSPPKVGGRLAHGLPKAPVVAAVPKGRPHANGALPAPPDVVPLAQPALPQEGQWQTTDVVNGLPAVRVTYVRPDAVHTSYVAGLVWMNPHLLLFALHPGSLDPGSGPWGGANTIPVGNRLGLLATFNSGFRLYASRGGYYANGHTAVPLRPGAASVVIYRNGSATVGVWDKTVALTPDVVAVRQNLAPIVLHGQPVAGLDQNVEQQWGATLGNSYYVWRSALGVTASGALVYASGPALSVSSLASLLVRAGCRTGMELDINPAWTQYVLYRAGATPSDPVPQNLLPSMAEPPDRYYTEVSRDFFSVYAR